MNASSGRFHDYKQHHHRWFTMFKGGHIFEIWFGNRWFLVDWQK